MANLLEIKNLTKVYNKKIEFQKNFSNEIQFNYILKYLLT